MQSRPEPLEGCVEGARDTQEAQAGQLWPEYPMHKPLRSYESFRVDYVPGMPAHEATRIRQIGTLLYNMLLAFNPDAREALVIAGLFARSVGMNIATPLAFGKDAQGHPGYRGFAGEAVRRPFVEYGQSIEKLVVQLTDAALTAGQMRGIPDMVAGALLLWLVAGTVNSKTTLALAQDMAQRETWRGEVNSGKHPKAPDAEGAREAKEATSRPDGGAPDDATGEAAPGA